MKKVYILLSRTGTFPSKLIYLFTRKKYTHASIALEPAADKFYSYGRRRLHNVFVAGFIHENVHSGVFELFKEGSCELFMLEVPDESYAKIKELVDFHTDNYDKCKYRYSVFMTMPMGIENKLDLKLACSQFVAKMLYESDACKLPKPPSLMHPTDFMSIDNVKSIYSGKIKDFRFPEQSE